MKAHASLHLSHLQFFLPILERETYQMGKKEIRSISFTRDFDVIKSENIFNWGYFTQKVEN